MLTTSQTEESSLRKNPNYKYLTYTIYIETFQKENNIKEINDNENLKDMEIEKNEENEFTQTIVKQIGEYGNMKEGILNDKDYKLENTNYHFLNDIINFMEEKNETIYSKTKTIHENIKIINVQLISQENQDIQIFSHEIIYHPLEANKHFKKTALNTEAQNNA